MMEVNYTKLNSLLLNSQMEERQKAHYLQKIRDLYTMRREGLPEKEWSEEEVSAYASFYLPTNMKKFFFLLEQLPAEIKEKLKTSEVIDFGTGPGTYLLAFLIALGGDKAYRLVGVDKEELMLSQARNILEGFYPHLKNKMHLHPTLPERSSDKDRFLIFGHSLNELHTDFVLDLLKKSEADHVLFLEPGVPAVYDQMMIVREWMAKKGFHCLFPCPNLKGACPIQKRVEEGKEDWCHQVWRGSHSAEVDRLGQLAQLDRSAMAFIGHFYTRVDGALKKPTARFVRFVNESKHSFTWEVCLENSEGLELCQFEIPKRPLSKQEQKELKKTSVGTNFDYDVIKVLGDGKRRVSISFPE